MVHLGPHDMPGWKLRCGLLVSVPLQMRLHQRFMDLRCREGDLVTVTSRADLQRAMQEAVTASQSSPHGPRLSNTLPPIRLQLAPVASEVGLTGIWHQSLDPVACASATACCHWQLVDVASDELLEQRWCSSSSGTCVAQTLDK